MTDRRSAFMKWLKGKAGHAYVWGGQGEVLKKSGPVEKGGRIICDNWQDWVRRRETSEENGARAMSYIKRKFEKGMDSIEAYDCSGLIMAYLKDEKGYLDSDMSARGLFTACVEKEHWELEPGDLLFRHNGRSIHHVGVYLGGGLCVEAKGRDAGVVICGTADWGANYWNRYGSLELLNKKEGGGTEMPRPELCEVTGGSVNLRTGPGTGWRVTAIAHCGDLGLALPPSDGWRHCAIYIEDEFVVGWMSEKYLVPASVREPAEPK